MEANEYLHKRLSAKAKDAQKNPRENVERNKHTCPDTLITAQMFLGFTQTPAGAHICSQEKAKKNSLLQHRDQIPTATTE